MTSLQKTHLVLCTLYQGHAKVSRGKRVNLGLLPTQLRSDPEGAAAIGNHLIVAVFLVSALDDVYM